MKNLQEAIQEVNAVILWVNETNNIISNLNK